MFSSVHLQNKTYTFLASLIITIMTAVLMHSNCISTLKFSAASRSVQVSVMSFSFPAADCSVLMDQRL